MSAGSPDSDKPSCRGCNRPSNSTLESHVDRAAYLCEACKKFHCRYRTKIQDESCTCKNKNGPDENCRFCRFQRCDLAVSERRTAAATPKQTKLEESKLATEKVDFSKIPCAVCGYSSSGFHFGAVSCEGCKGFFRRSMNKSFKIQYSCKGIHGGTEKKLCPASSNCRKCRLKRCTNAGMSLNEVSIGRHTLHRKAEIDATLKKHASAGSFLREKLFRRGHVSTSGVDTIDDDVVSTSLNSNIPEVSTKDENDSDSSIKISPLGVDPFPSVPSQPSEPSPLLAADSKDIRGTLKKSSEWFIERAVVASAKLAQISSWKVVLQPHFTNEQIVAERVRALDIGAKCISDFATTLPGNNQIGLGDRILLFTQSYFPISCAQYCLTFDIERQEPNHMNLDREGPAFAMCMSKYEWEADIENYLIEAGNSFVECIKSLKDFALLCALLYLNPDTPNLEDRDAVRAIRTRFDIAVLEYFTNRPDSSSTSEESMCKFYQILSFMRRAQALSRHVFTAIYVRRPEDRVAWTPLFHHLISNLIGMPSSGGSSCQTTPSSSHQTPPSNIQQPMS